MRILAAILNIILIGFTLFLLCTTDGTIGGWQSLLVLVMLICPVVNLIALFTGRRSSKFAALEKNSKT